MRRVTVKIASLPTFDAAAERVVEVWRGSGKPMLIRVEGFDGAGKTGLARLVKERIGGEHVEGDKFAFKPEVPTPYRECLRRDDLDAAIERAVASGYVVILDAVCLEEVAPSERWGRGFVVYVKRLSFSTQVPIWHEGLSLEDEAPTREVHRSIHLYHNRAKPHETADLIIELPTVDYAMTPGKFDRNMCFDPPEGELI
jgi:hypothetical protein